MMDDDAINLSDEEKKDASLKPAKTQEGNESEGFKHERLVQH